MRSRRGQPGTTTFVVMASLLAGFEAISSASAGESACTRLVPGVEFPLAVQYPEFRFSQAVAVDREEGDSVRFITSYQISPDQRAHIVALEPTGSRRLALHELGQVDIGGSSPVAHIDLADVTGDGRRDIVVQLVLYSSTPTWWFAVLAGTESGFAPPRIAKLEDFVPTSIPVYGDFNGDGRAEIAVSGARSPNGLGIYTFDGAGSLSLLRMHTKSYSRLLFSADADRDGDDDLIAVTSDYAGQLVRLNGDPELTLEAQSGIHLPARSVLGAGKTEYDHDSLADIFLVMSSPLELLVLRNDGTGGFDFTQQSLLPIGATQYSMIDLDADRDDDFTFSLRVPDRNPVLGTARNEDGQFELPLTIDEPYQSFGASDLDGDHNVDLVVLSPEGNGLIVVPGLGEAVFTTDIVRTPVPRGSRPVVADFDGDGFDDIARVIVDSAGRLPVEMLYGRADGTLERQDGATGLPSFQVREASAMDLNNDGLEDLLITSNIFQSGGPGYVALNQGGRRFLPFAPLPVPGMMLRAAQGDFDGDGRLDLAYMDYRERRPFHNYYRYKINCVLSRGSEFVPFATVDLAVDYYAEIPSWLVADLDADGRGDLVLADQAPDLGFSKRRLAWHRSTPEGLAPQSTIASFTYGFNSPGDVLSGDIDGDTTVDLVLNTGPQGEIRSFRGLGGGRFEQLQAIDRSDYGHVSLSDLDRDGRLDLISASGIATWPGIGSGRFTPIAEQWYREFRGDSALSDLNGDHVPEVVTVAASSHEAWLSIQKLHASPLPEDIDLPRLSVELRPVLSNVDEPVGFQNQWQVLTPIDDDCDSRPRVVAAWLGFAAAPATATIGYRPSSDREIRSYGTPVSHVVLLGPNESEMRMLYAELSATGKASIHPGSQVGLSAVDSLGVPAIDLGDQGLVPYGPRLSSRWIFSAGVVQRAAVFGEQSDLIATALGEDHSGKTRLASASLRETIAAQPR